MRAAPPPKGSGTAHMSVRTSGKATNAVANRRYVARFLAKVRDCQPEASGRSGAV